MKINESTALTIAIVLALTGVVFACAGGLLLPGAWKLVAIVGALALMVLAGASMEKVEPARVRVRIDS